MVPQPPPPATMAPQLLGDMRETHSDWVRLGTLTLLRWIAIVGQTGTIVVATWILGIQLDVWLCGLAVGLSALTNALAMTLFPASRRLSEQETLLLLIFDTAQLAFLIGITGGLNNPFALMILAPATITATALRGRSTAVVGTLAVALVTLVWQVHLPLVAADGTLIQVPPLFGFGQYLALVIGIVFLSHYARRVASELHSMASALMATQMALAREQRLTVLGGVVAAAAHELGTPLATIKLISSEMAQDLADPEAREDARTIVEQADRCRDILRGMGQAGKDDAMVRAAPLSDVLREAAEPHAQRGKVLHMPAPLATGREPFVQRRPEIIHALRNVIQNATDFARGNVWIDAEWTADQLRLTISDDGPGFPSGVIGRIGDPFMRGRQSDAEASRRPGYDGMGLGLFIAKTLLERSGAQMSFANGGDPFLSESERPVRSGAIVTIRWPRHAIEVEHFVPLGENPQVTA